MSICKNTYLHSFKNCYNETEKYILLPVAGCGDALHRL
ncbi:hypothetical protein FLA_1554 [Filimonas lacunae]|nr:hypothetical protein FLA_1554 [Filimonas lacunae]